MTDLSLAHHIAALLPSRSADIDPAETSEWCEALDALTAAHGPERARAGCSTPCSPMRAAAA